MTTIALTAADFEQTVTENEIVLVDFWAAWCGPCRQFSPIYDQASTKHPDVVFGKVDTEAEQALSAAAQISSIPTIMAFRDGICVFSQAGSLRSAALEQVIQGVRDLDMDDVRAKVAVARSGEGDLSGDAAGTDVDARQTPARSAGTRAGIDFPDDNGAIV